MTDLQKIYPEVFFHLETTDRAPKESPEKFQAINREEPKADIEIKFYIL